MKWSPNKKGAALMWAVVAVLLIAIVSAGIVFVCRTYYMRERNESYRLQARFYAESAIELIAEDIVQNDEASPYISDGNTTHTVDIEFPDASNWKCQVAVHHSKVNLSTPEDAKKSGDIYLTARVTRADGNGGQKELSEVCAKLSYDSTAGGWVFKGYYNM